MYENSPEYFKKFQKRFKYTICENEPKLENSAVENYAYGYHSSSASVESCTSGSNDYHVIYEIGKRGSQFVWFFVCSSGNTLSGDLFCLLRKILIKEVPLFLDYMFLWSICWSQIILQSTKQGKKFLHHTARAWSQQQQLLPLHQADIVQFLMWLWDGFVSKCLANIPLLFPKIWIFYWAVRRDSSGRLQIIC